MATATQTRINLQIVSARGYAVTLDGFGIGTIERQLPAHATCGLWIFQNSHGAFGHVQTRQQAIDALVELSTR